MIGKSFKLMVNRFCSLNSSKFIIGLKLNNQSIYYSRINLNGDIKNSKVLSLNNLPIMDERYNQLKADKFFKELFMKINIELRKTYQV